MPEALKNSYNIDYVSNLAKVVGQHRKRFPTKRFIESVIDSDWEERELKQRMSHIRVCLHEALKLPFDQALNVLIPAAEHFGGYEAMFFPEYVEAYGLDHWDRSMQALETLTQYSSSEFAVRPFILRDSERMMKQMVTWSRHDNPHVRRLASEGCRPRLPWAQALPVFKKQPEPILPILDNLKADDSLYVRRSVANNLNDISKDNPQVTLKWAKANIGKHSDTDWIIKHASRTLLKQGHPKALGLFGYRAADHVKIAGLSIENPNPKIGDTMAFSFEVSGKRGRAPLGKLRVEYAIDYLKANGSHSRKVFKVAEGDYRDPNLSFQRQQSFRQMSTRKHYAGEHRLAIIVNGVERALATFDLKR
jgi:3-methyladenine DNA glycosylase AlkC